MEARPTCVGTLAARLESACVPDGVLLAYETHALVQDHIETEEQPPIHVKGIAREVRPFAVKGIFDDADIDQSIIRSENPLVRLHVDLKKLEPAERLQVADELEMQARRLRDINSAG